MQKRFNPLFNITSGKWQTILGYSIPVSPFIGQYSSHKIPTPDGDQLLVHLHNSHNYGKRMIVILHGFTGCAQSKYILRMCRLLVKHNYSVLRVNLRGAGDSTYYCKKLYHAGKTEDIRLVLEWIKHNYPDKRVTLLGYSLGGNVALKTGCDPIDPTHPLDSIIAVSTPLELKRCTLLLGQRQNKIFNDHFVKFVINEVNSLKKNNHPIEQPDLSNVTNIYQFDDIYTAPLNGFRDADDYYEQSSSYNHLHKLHKPTFILHAMDDPFIAKVSYEKLPKQNITALLTPFGGHLGWVANPLKSPLRWMDDTILKSIQHFDTTGSFYAPSTP